MSPSTPGFDKLSFRAYIKDIGRAYRKQATELVSICRIFVQAQEQTLASDASLRVALELVDDALKSATEAVKKKSKEADDKFSKAIESLKQYEERFHPSNLKKKPVEERMREAKANDESSSMVINRLKDAFHPIKEVPTKQVKFLLQKSLLDESPNTVTQELCGSSDLNEVLWNFSRFKGNERLTLKQNPHFYTRLPTSSKQYGGKFISDPIERFQHDMISVLTDGTDWVYMEIAEKRRAFRGVWNPNNAIIFKDVCGKLEGEGIVGGAIQDIHNLSCFEVSLQSSTSRPTIQDWREPILTMLRSQSGNRMVRITANKPGNCSPGSSSPPRPWPPSMRDRHSNTIRGTNSKSPSSKQSTSPPTTSTNVLTSSRSLSRPQAEPTAAPSSSVVSPPPRKSRTSPPHTARTSAPPPSSEASPSHPSQPVPTIAPPSSVLLQPRTSSASSARPASTVATPSSTASRIPHYSSPQPPPISASRVTGVAPSIGRPPLDVSSNREPHGGVSQGAVPGTSRSPISKAPPSDGSAATNTSLGVGRTGHEGTDRRIPIQAPGHSPRVEDARTDRASLPPQVQAQAIDSQPKTQPVSKKRSWFQKHIWDYGNK